MEAGIAEETFWRQTPAQTQRAVRSRREREDRLRDVVAWHALHVPLIHLEATATGKFPSLDSLRALVNGRPEPEPTDEQLLEQGRRIFSALARAHEEGT